MSFACQYCSVCPRHPCNSQGEAATCPNATRGMWHDFDAKQVADWIEYNAGNDHRLLEAAELIRQKL